MERKRERVIIEKNLPQCLSVSLFMASNQSWSTRGLTCLVQFLNDFDFDDRKGCSVALSAAVSRLVHEFLKLCLIEPIRHSYGRQQWNSWCCWHWFVYYIAWSQVVRVKFLWKNVNAHLRLGVFKQCGPGQWKEQVIPSTFGLSYTMCWGFIYENEKITLKVIY